MEDFIQKSYMLCTILACNFTKEQAKTWLDTPMAALNNQSPRDYINRGDINSVLAIL